VQVYLFDEFKAALCVSRDRLFVTGTGYLI